MYRRSPCSQSKSAGPLHPELLECRARTWPRSSGWKEYAPEVAAPAEPPRVAASHVPIRNSNGFHVEVDDVCPSRPAAQNSTAATSFLVMFLLLFGRA